jgi:GxxExxY protein
MAYENDEEAPFVEPDAELNALSRAVIGAAIEVHRHWGPGLEEALYEAALCEEMRLRNIPFACQVWLDVLYKGSVLGRRRVDLIVADRIVVELKSVEQLTPLDRAQLLTYLKITGFPLGLLINFNSVVLKDGVKRVILT